MRRATTIAAVVVLAGSSARADEIARGHLVKVEASEIYFDIGAAKKLEVGDRLRIKRPIALRHPVTRIEVRDWIPIGSARVTLVGAHLSMARLDKQLLAQVAVGDQVEVLVVEPVTGAAPKPAPKTPPGPKPEPKLDPETAKVLAVWQNSAGRSLDERIAAWEAYLESDPESRYAASVRQDVRALRRLRSELRPPELELGEPTAAGVEHRAPRRARAARPLELVFLLEQPRKLAAAWLHYRARGQTTYQRTRLRLFGDGYLRGTIPAGGVRGPGVEYFAEIASTDGRAGAAAGTASTPTQVAVERIPPLRAFAERARRSRISITSAYLDFATFDDRAGDHTDRFLMMEIDFAYRLRTRIHAVRAGFGSIQGRGGFADRVFDDTNPAPKVGFNYGYGEVEVRGPHTSALLVRLIAGVGRTGFGAGIDLRGRLGPEEGTNLSLGIESLSEVGLLSDLRMQWNARPRFPLGFAVAVTDQPNRGDLGVRLSADVGYRMGVAIPTLRISYQARNLDHAGVGAGLGMVFDW